MPASVSLVMDVMNVAVHKKTNTLNKWISGAVLWNCSLLDRTAEKKTAQTNRTLCRTAGSMGMNAVDHNWRSDELPENNKEWSGQKIAKSGRYWQCLIWLVIPSMRPKLSIVAFSHFCGMTEN